MYICALQNFSNVEKLYGLSGHSIYDQIRIFVSGSIYYLYSFYDWSCLKDLSCLYLFSIHWDLCISYGLS